jgi:hypothetical protein
MGILDDAIRDHLDLKRRRGTDEPEIKRLEDEAFGPPGRPDASGVSGPTASAVAEPPVETASPEITPEDLGLESMPETPPSAETPPPDGPAPEEPPAPAPETTSDAGAGSEPAAENGGEVVFHDFAAEEGLVSGRSRAEQPIEPSDPVERALAQPPATDEPSSEEPEAEAEAEAPSGEAMVEAEAPDPSEAAPVAEPPAPHSEDTQVHDMAKELEIEPEKPSAPPAGDAGEGAEGEPALELDVEELDIELDDELDLGEGEATGADAEDDDDGEDVLEETPEFLRDAPESDRLWFEQGKPKDFDFDDE